MRKKLEKLRVPPPCGCINEKSHQQLTSFKWGQEKKKLQIKYLHLASSQPVSLHFTSLVLSKQWLHFCTGGRRNTRELQMNLKPLVGGQGTWCYALLSHNSTPRINSKESKLLFSTGSCCARHVLKKLKSLLLPEANLGKLRLSVSSTKLSRDGKTRTRKYLNYFAN